MIGRVSPGYSSVVSASSCMSYSRLRCLSYARPPTLWSQVRNMYWRNPPPVESEDQRYIAARCRMRVFDLRRFAVTLMQSRRLPGPHQEGRDNPCCPSSLRGGLRRSTADRWPYIRSRRTIVCFSVPARAPRSTSWPDDARPAVAPSNTTSEESHSDMSRWVVDYS